MKSRFYPMGVGLIIIGFLICISSFYSFMVSVPIFLIGVVFVFLSEKKPKIKWFVTLIPVILFLPLGFECELYLPFQITRHQDIVKGNEIADNISEYSSREGEVPSEQDTVFNKHFGFDEQGDGVMLHYTKLSKYTYKIVFIEGFDGPYLTYKSTTRQWTMEQ